jgi:hypothetical protein
MMFVSHDAIHTSFVSQNVLLVVLVIECVGLFRVKVAIGEAQPPRVIFFQVFFFYVYVWLLRVEENLDMVFHNKNISKTFGEINADESRSEPACVQGQGMTEPSIAPCFDVALGISLADLDAYWAVV